MSMKLNLLKKSQALNKHLSDFESVYSINQARNSGGLFSLTTSDAGHRTWLNYYDQVEHGISLLVHC